MHFCHKERHKKHQKSLLIQTLAIGLLLTSMLPLTTQAEEQTHFKSVRTQFIAALGDAAANSGNNAQRWGIWREDPGPRGVRLSRYAQLEKANGVAPAGWHLDRGDWWMEEHGLIMEQPDFPLAPGKYLVTGGRELTTVLTISEKDSAGNQHWELAEGTLYDVTHLACRSARYKPSNETFNNKHACLPTNANQKAFPVRPGATMPAVEGCDKQDYAVLFIIGVAD